MYLSEALESDIHLINYFVDLDIKKPLFLKNLLVCFFQLIYLFLKKSLNKKVSLRLLYYSTLRRPAYIGGISSQIERFINSQNIKPKLIIQWGAIFAPYKKWDFGIPFVLIIDNYMESPDSITKNNLSRRWDSLYDKEFYDFQKEVFNKSALIFTLSNWCREGLIKEFNLDPKKVVAIGWGPAKKTSLNQSFLKIEKTILTIGSDYSSKGIDVLIKCAAFLPDFKITIVGKDPAYKNFNFPPNILIKSHLTENELIELYQQSELFFIFSKFDPSPHVLWEAQALGCVVVGFDSYGISECVINNKTGLLLETRDPELISKQIRQLYAKSDVIPSFRKASIDNFIQNGRWSKASEKIINKLNEYVFR